MPQCNNNKIILSLKEAQTYCWWQPSTRVVQCLTAQSLSSGKNIITVISIFAKCYFPLEINGSFEEEFALFHNDPFLEEQTRNIHHKRAQFDCWCWSIASLKPIGVHLLCATTFSTTINFSIAVEITHLCERFTYHLGPQPHPSPTPLSSFFPFMKHYTIPASSLPI